LEIHVTDAFVSRAIYSQATDIPRVHSSWKHIEESTTETSVTLHDGESLWLAFFVENDCIGSLDESSGDSTSHSFASPFLQVSLEKLVSIHQEIDTDVLPVNAVLIKYRKSSDSKTHSSFSTASRGGATGETISTRIPLSLCELLVERGALIDPSSSSSLVMEPSRFDDDVFHTLDSVVPSPARQRVESLGGLGDLTSENPVFLPLTALPNPVGDEQALGEMAGVDSSADLAALLQEEREALELELSQLHHQLLRSPKNGSNLLLDLCQDIAETESQIIEVQEASIQLQIDFSRAQFLVETQRIRLVRDLSNLFPITSVATNGSKDVCYRIRGLQLPNYVQIIWVGPGTFAEDEVAAALGYTVQVLNCLSRYLSIEMRHSMWFQSSRSAIQDAATGTVYPLFSSRQDREKFIAAWELLDANVNKLTSELQLSLPSMKPLPLLGKVAQVYQSIADGS
jgi:hypothetical protein